MDMTVFQVESNKVLPCNGSLLISAPFLKDYHFSRSVVLVIEHNDEGTMGIVLNKSFSRLTTLNELIPSLEFVPPIPLYKGGPISRETIFFLHTLSFLKGALPMGNGLYLNGDFEEMKQYILGGGPTQGVVRFFSGYAGWMKGQLQQEIAANTWLVNNHNNVDLLNMYLRDLWQETLTDLGGKYAIWARYPQFPIMN